MKPGSRDRKYSIKIAGAELVALKACCLDLPESFGLDRRIEKYQGTRPIGFWRWDLDCLVDVLSLELKRPGFYTERGPKLDRSALQAVYERVKGLHEDAYAEFDA